MLGIGHNVESNQERNEISRFRSLSSIARNFLAIDLTSTKRVNLAFFNGTTVALLQPVGNIIKRVLLTCYVQVQLSLKSWTDVFTKIRERMAVAKASQGYSSLSCSEQSHPHKIASLGARLKSLPIRGAK